jgi:hypothetical protein
LRGVSSACLKVPDVAGEKWGVYLTGFLAQGSSASRPLSVLSQPLSSFLPRSRCTLSAFRSVQGTVYRSGKMVLAVRGGRRRRARPLLITAWLSQITRSPTHGSCIFSPLPYRRYLCCVHTVQGAVLEEIGRQFAFDKPVCGSQPKQLETVTLPLLFHTQERVYCKLNLR